jgi:hypothetical protein
MLRPIAAAFATLTLVVTTAGAQTTSRWALAWTDDSYRVVDGKRVPVGEQTAVLSITPTRGDSVHRRTASDRTTRADGLSRHHFIGASRPDGSPPQ